MDRPSRFGALLKQLRIAAGLTQEELAERAGLSPRAISALERGVNRAPRSATLAAIADALPLRPAERAALEAVARPRTPAARAQPHDASTEPGEAGRLPRHAPPFVGRAAELALLERHIQGEGPTVALIVGEPGIGKSRLLHEVGSLARARGQRVAEGRSPRHSAQEPYAPLLDAIAQCIDDLTSRERAELLPDACWLTRLLPELAQAGLVPEPPPALAPAQERRLMFQAVSRLCARIAEAHGLVLLLDDLQWASPDALDLLVSLALAAGDSGTRILAAFRGTELQADGPLADALEELARHELARSLPLGPLEQHDAAALLRGLLPGSAADAHAAALLRRTGGIPFFLIHCAQDIRADGADEIRPGALPWSVAQSVRQRVARLPGAAPRLLEAAALMGTASLPALLALGERLGSAPGEVQRTIDAACQDRLLVEQEDRTYGFAHDLIREVLEAEIGPAARVLLHTWIAEILEAAGGASDPGVVAYQYIRGNQWDRAAAHLERAGDRAMAARAIAEASDLYAELAAGLDGIGRAAWAAAVREKLAAALLHLARYDEALRALDLALAAYRAAADGAGTLRTLARAGEVHALRGTPQAGLDLLAPVVAAPPEGRLPARDAAPAWITYAWLLNACGRYAEALPVAEQAAQLARAGEDAAHIIQADLRRSQLLLMLGHLDTGARVLEEVIPLAEAAGDLRSLRLALNSLGWVHEARGEFARDAQQTERAYGVAQRLGDPTVLAFMTSNRGGPAFNLGQWDRARADFEAGLALMRPLGPTWASAWPPLLLGRLDLAQGRHESAEQLLAAAIEQARRSGDLQAQRWAQAALAERDLLDGAAAAASERLSLLLDRPDQQESDVTPLLPLLAWAWLDQGDLARAEGVIEQAIARAAAAGMRPALAGAWRVRALLRQRQGRWEPAEQDLAAALAAFQHIGAPYGQAVVRYEQGRLALRRGTAAEARRHLEAARSLLAALGERLYGEGVDALLADLPADAAHSRRQPARRTRPA